MKSLIKKNLLLRIDFKNRYVKEKKKAKQITDFYLVGFLPILVIKENEEKERAYLQIPVKIKKNPYARMLHGARVKDLKKIQKIIKDKFNLDVDYSEKVDKIIEKTNLAVEKAIEAGELGGKKIKELYVINTDKKE